MNYITVVRAHVYLIIIIPWHIILQKLVIFLRLLFFQHFFTPNMKLFDLKMNVSILVFVHMWRIELLLFLCIKFIYWNCKFVILVFYVCIWTSFRGCYRRNIRKNNFSYFKTGRIVCLCNYFLPIFITKTCIIFIVEGFINQVLGLVTLPLHVIDCFFTMTYIYIFKINTSNYLWIFIRPFFNHKVFLDVITLSLSH